MRSLLPLGTALKPAHEPIVVARKPLVGTVAENVLRHGTGALNIDGCRVPVETGDERSGGFGQGNRPWQTGGTGGNTLVYGSEIDRWPANVIHDGSEEVLEEFAAQSKRAGVHQSGKARDVIHDVQYDATSYHLGKTRRLFRYDEPREVGGTAARFFYCAKASRRDREEGLEEFAQRETSLKYQGDQGFSGRTQIDGEWVNTGKEHRRKPRNHHPTVKPTELMRYLCRLVTPPGGLVLDPFMGSGSTGKGAVLEGFRFLGIELDADYLEIASARICHAMDLWRKELETPKQAGLFD